MIQKVAEYYEYIDKRMKSSSGQCSSLLISYENIRIAGSNFDVQ